MKFIRVFSLLLAMLLMVGSFAACGKKSQQSAEPNDPYFDAVVFAVNSNQVHVGPLSGELEMSAAADKGILINKTMLDGSSLDWLEPGMLIRITYNGMITYSIPAQINGVIHVDVLED